MQLASLASALNGLNVNGENAALTPVETLIKKCKGLSQSAINEITAAISAVDDKIFPRHNLALQSVNPDRQIQNIPVMVQKRGGVHTEGQIVLESIKLPPSLRQKLGKATVMEWVKSLKVAERIDFQTNGTPVYGAAFAAAMPISHAQGKAIFTPTVQVEQGSNWIFLCYNLSGDNYGAWSIEINSESPCKIQAGEQSDFSLDSASANLDEKRAIVVVGLSLEKEHSHKRYKWYESESFPHRIFTQGNRNVIPYDASSYTGSFTLNLDESFIALGLGVPVNLESLEPAFVKNYLDQLKDNMQASLTTAVTKLFGPPFNIEDKLKKLGLPLNPKPQVCFSEKLNTLVYNWTGNAAKFDIQDGTIRINNMIVQGGSFWANESIDDTNPIILSFEKGKGGKESLDPRTIVVYDWNSYEGKSWKYAISVLHRVINPQHVTKIDAEKMADEGIVERAAQFL